MKVRTYKQIRIQENNTFVAKWSEYKKKTRSKAMKEIIEKEIDKRIKDNEILKSLED